MGFANRYNSQDEIPEDVRGDFVEDTINEQYKGTWVSKDVFTLEKSLANERKEHKATKANLTSLNEKITALQGQVDQFTQLGSLEELAALRKKLDTENPPKTEELQKALSDAREKLRAAESWRSTNEPLLAELQAEKQKYEVAEDRAKAKETISAVVKGIQGANAEALLDNLYYQYLAGNLKRNAIGEIVRAEDGAALEDFASKYAKEHGLIQANVPGGAKPPAGANPNGSKAALMAKYEEARKRKDALEMMKIKTELNKLPQ